MLKGKEALWQYHPRSDHHSKVACWGILFDLLHHSKLLREHFESGRLVFGINQEMRRFVRDDVIAASPALDEAFADE